MVSEGESPGVSNVIEENLHGGDMVSQNHFACLNMEKGRSRDSCDMISHV